MRTLNRFISVVLVFGFVADPSIAFATAFYSLHENLELPSVFTYEALSLPGTQEPREALSDAAFETAETTAIQLRQTQTHLPMEVTIEFIPNGAHQNVYSYAQGPSSTDVEKAVEDALRRDDEGVLTKALSMLGIRDEGKIRLTLHRIGRDDYNEKFRVDINGGPAAFRIIASRCDGGLTEEEKRAGMMPPNQATEENFTNLAKLEMLDSKYVSKVYALGRGRLPLRHQLSDRILLLDPGAHRQRSGSLALFSTEMFDDAVAVIVSPLGMLEYDNSSPAANSLVPEFEASTVRTGIIQMMTHYFDLSFDPHTQEGVVLGDVNLAARHVVERESAGHLAFLAAPALKPMSPAKFIDYLVNHRWTHEFEEKQVDNPDWPMTYVLKTSLHPDLRLYWHVLEIIVGMYDGLRERYSASETISILRHWFGEYTQEFNTALNPPGFRSTEIEQALDKQGQPAAENGDRGLIFRGDPQKLFDAFIHHNTSLKEWPTSLPRAQWLARLKTRFAEMERQNVYDQNTADAIRHALLDLESFDLAVFDEIRLGAVNAHIPAREWLFGFNTESVDSAIAQPDDSRRLVGLLRAHIVKPTIGLSRGIVQQSSGDTFLEALLYLSLSPYLGHRRSRDTLQIFFAHSNYRHAEQQRALLNHNNIIGNFDGSFSLLIRLLIEGTLRVLTTEPLIQKRVGTEEGSWPATVLDEAYASGIAVVFGMSGIGKSPDLRRMGLAVYNFQNPVEEWEAFLRNNTGKIIVLDEFHWLGSDVKPVLEHLRHSMTPAILVSPPGVEYTPIIADYMNWKNEPAQAFRIAPKRPGEFQSEIERSLNREGRNVYSANDWALLYRLAGGNLLDGWNVLGVSNFFGINPQDINLDLLFSFSPADHHSKALEAFGHFQAKKFDGFWEACRIKLFEFYESFSLLQHIAFTPLALDKLAIDWMPREQELIYRLLDYGVLQITGAEIEIRGDLYRYFLRHMSPRQFWMEPTTAHPIDTRVAA